LLKGNHYSKELFIKQLCGCSIIGLVCYNSGSKSMQSAIAS